MIVDEFVVGFVFVYVVDFVYGIVAVDVVIYMFDAVYEVPDSVLYLEIQPQHYLTFTFAPFLEIIVKEIFTIIIKINSTKPIANNA